MSKKESNPMPEHKKPPPPMVGIANDDYKAWCQRIADKQRLLERPLHQALSRAIELLEKYGLRVTPFNQFVNVPQEEIEKLKEICNGTR